MLILGPRGPVPRDSIPVCHQVAAVPSDVEAISIIVDHIRRPCRRTGLVLQVTVHLAQSPEIQEASSRVVEAATPVILHHLSSLGRLELVSLEVIPGMSTVSVLRAVPAIIPRVPVLQLETPLRQVRVEVTEVVV